MFVLVYDMEIKEQSHNMQYKNTSVYNGSVHKPTSTLQCPLRGHVDFINSYLQLLQGTSTRPYL